MDLGGAKDRPPLKEVWENVDAKLQGREASSDRFNCGEVTVILEKI
jgi:hypothetical protein